MWFFASKKGTPGAGDNLIASSIALSLGNYFREIRETDQGLEHTRLIIASFDAEEEGLRGARAFAKKHEEHFKNVKTYMINMDCLYDEKELFFLTSDLNNFVKLDDDLAQELMAISETLGIKTKTQPLAFLTGGTDAAELAKKGVHATTIIGMPWTNASRSNVYHTPKDTLEHVSPKVVSDTIQIIHRYIVEKDME
jgi:Zn-dependent M28 family amino/carboxypeptidase